MPSRADRLGSAPPAGGQVEVRAGEYVIGETPSVLAAPALGSCVGLSVYDPVKRRGGMAHIMLPAPLDDVVPMGRDRFAVFVVPKLVDELAALGIPRARMVAKFAGGSSMFGGDTQMASIGQRNAAEVRRQLGLLRVPLLAEDTGGSHARTVELHLESGLVVVRSYAYGIKHL